MKEETELFNNLISIMAKLRSPGGCPWDRKQDFNSLRTYVIEEAYEVVDAINKKDLQSIREELGDLLLQVVFLSRIAEEKNQFNIKDVIEGIIKKLIKRHPHVFGEENLNTPEEVLERWEEIKGKKEEFDLSILPATLRALEAGKIAGKYGYDWERTEDLFEKISEEVEELKDALKSKKKEAAEDEIGDLLFTVINLSRHLGVDPEVALFKRVNKFLERLKKAVRLIEREGKCAKELSPRELDLYWEKAKYETIQDS